MLEFVVLAVLIVVVLVLCANKLSNHELKTGPPPNTRVYNIADRRPNRRPERIQLGARALHQQRIEAARLVSEFAEFIKEEVISRFISHRDDSHQQFAVLVFSPFELPNISQTIIEAAKELDSEWKVFTSPDKYYPAGRNFTNFIVARPNGPAHAEEIIFDYGDLNNLCEERCIQQPIRTLLLYSWLMPCSKCTERIIEENGSLNGGRRMVVVYTKDWIEEEYNQRIRNRNSLRNNGIRVMRVDYNH